MSLPAYDNFNRGTGIGANWTGSVGGDLTIVDSTVCCGSTTGDNSMYWSADQPNADQYVQYVASDQTGWQGPAVRASATDWVFFDAAFNDATKHYKLEWYNGGAWTIIGSQYNVTPADGDTIRIEASGSTFTGILNGTQRCQGSNASAPATGYGGIYLYWDGKADDFEVGNLAGGPVSLTPAEASQSQISDAAGVTANNPSQSVSLTPAEGVQSQVSDAAGKAVVYILTASETAQSQISDTANVTFQGQATIVTPAEATQTQTSDTGNISQLTIASNHQVDVGNGFVDGTPQQIARTSDNRLWLASWKFDHYPQGEDSGLGQTLRVYKANQAGIPSTFSRMDEGNEPTNPAGWAIAVGSADILHIAWAQRTSWDGGTNRGTLGFIKYSQFNTGAGTWGTVETIASSLNAYDGGQGDEHVSLVIDQNGVPHVAFLKDDGTRRRVLYSNRSAGTWSAAGTVDDQSFTDAFRCWHPGIFIDQNQQFVFAWMRGTYVGETNGRMFVRHYDGTSVWGTTADVVGEDIWQGIDVVNRVYIDAANRYHLAYINTSKQIQYRYSDNSGTTWSQNSPGAGTTLGDDPVCGPGVGGSVRIYAHGPSTTNICYWEGAGGTASWGSQQNYITAGGYDCTVNVRYTRNFYHFPNIHDIAYWKSDYPTNELYVGVDVLPADVTPAEASQGQTSDIAARSVIYKTAPAETAQAQSSDPATVTFAAPSYRVSPAEAVQNQTSDAPAGNVIYKSVPAEAVQSQTSDAAGASYGIQFSITPAEASQSQISDAPARTIIYTRLPAEAVQSQVSDNAGVSFNGPTYALAPAEAIQTQNSDSCGVTFIAAGQAVGVTPAEGMQSQSSDAVTLSVVYRVTATEGAQSQISDSALVEFTAPTYFVLPGEALQTQAMDLPGLGVVYLVLPVEDTQSQNSDGAGVTIGGVFDHGERRVYPINTRPTHYFPVRVDLEVDD